MIGFFDSGFGGLTVLKEVVKLLPQYSYLYLGDNARTPYGNRSQEVIYQFTTEGVGELFKRGAKLVILACNTSSSGALRRIQQEFLPRVYPERSRRVLGIIIPTAEKIEKFTSTKEVGILATEATVNSLAYPKEIRKVSPEIRIYQQACPLLVPVIEAGEIESLKLEQLIGIYVDNLFSQSSKIDAVILGCTHYAIIEGEIKKHLPQNVKLVSQGPIIAQRLKDYLRRHPEIENRISKNSERLFFTTENSKRVRALSGLFYGEPLELEIASL